MIFSMLRSVLPLWPAIRCCSTQKSPYVRLMRLQEELKTLRERPDAFLPNSRFLIFHKGKPLLDGQQQLVWKSCDSVNKDIEEHAVLLKVDEASGCPLYAVPVDDPSTVDSKDEFFTDMRVAMFSCALEESKLACHAWTLLRWNRKTKFCANCATPLERTPSGNQRSCLNCRAVYYPSPAPVGIALVEAHDRDEILLIRQPRYPPGMYSCVAGFVDPGESLAECVRREVAEEAGIEIKLDSVQVHSSQHWPFPSGSLMTGCIAKALPNEQPDPLAGELEDARWFSLFDVQSAFDRIQEDPSLRLRGDPKQLFVPPKNAIAHHLIKDWIRRKTHAF